MRHITFTVELPPRRVDSLRGEQETAALEDKSAREGEAAAAAGGEEDEARLVTVHELVEAVERLQKTPDDSKLEQITEVCFYQPNFLRKLSHLCACFVQPWSDECFRNETSCFRC